MNLFEKKYIAILSIGLAVSFATGWYQGRVNMRGELVALLQSTPSADNIYTIFGMLEDINGNVVTLKTSLTNNPTDALTHTREVLIKKDTKFSRGVSKAQDVFLKEFVSYQQALTTSLENASLMPPEPFIEEPFRFNMLKKGDLAYIDTRLPLFNTRLEALRIVVQSE